MVGKRSIWLGVVALLVVVSLQSCAAISPFSQVAYENATSLKVEALSLMDNATQPFEDHIKAVEALSIKMKKAQEYARGLPKNQLSAKQWDILTDPNGNLLGGFLRRWAQESTLSPLFITEAQAVVSDAFDTIIGLESGKIKPKDVERGGR